MTDQITVPRATLDAMREALERIADKRNTHFAGDAQVLASSALTAANAVQHPNDRDIAGENQQSTNEQCAANAVSEQQGLSPESARAMVAEMDMNDRVLAAIDAEPQATEPAWRSIETAPKDGSEILLFGDGRVTSGNWSAPSEVPRLIYRDGFAPEEEWDEWEPYWASWDGGFTEEHPPTHWQPKPAAPEAKQ